MQMDLDHVIELALAAHDLTPEGPARLEGGSGASYELGLLATRQGRRIVVEFLWDRPATAEDVEQLERIIHDTHTAEAILCSVKGFTGAPGDTGAVEVWDRGALERAIGAHLLDQALGVAETPRAEPDDEHSSAGPASIPFPSSEPEVAEAASESDAEILPGRADRQPTPQDPPPQTPPPTADDDSDAEILPGRADREVPPPGQPTAAPKVDEQSGAEILPGRGETEAAPSTPGPATPPDASGAEFLPGRADRAPAADEPEATSEPEQSPPGPPPFPSSSPEPTEREPASAPPPAPATSTRRPRGDGGFLAGRTIAPTVSEDDARRIAAGPLFATRNAELELLPFHVFRYRAELEGGDTTRDASGHVWVSALTGGCSEAPEVELVSDLDMPFTRIAAKIEASQAAPAVDAFLADSLSVREEVIADHGEAAVIENVTFRPRRGSVHLEPLGQAYVPRWRVEGQNGEVFVDAVTGELLSA